MEFCLFIWHLSVHFSTYIQYKQWLIQAPWAIREFRNFVEIYKCMCVYDNHQKTVGMELVLLFMPNYSELEHIYLTT